MRRYAALFTLVALPSLATASTTAPHMALSRSDPEAGSTIAAAPARVSLWFTGRPELAFSRIRLTGPSGDVALDSIVPDSAFSLRAAILGPMPAGDYRVVWQTAAADGHLIRGEFSFRVLASSFDPTARLADTLVAVAGGTEAGGAGDSGYRSVRWLEFAALLAVLGALGFRHGVLPPLALRGVPTADAADRARRLGLSILVAYGVAALVRLYTQSATLSGAEGAWQVEALSRLLLRTTWGFGWSIGVIGAAILLVGWLTSKRSVTIGTPLALTGALGMVLSPALSGHAAASRHFVWSVTLDALHVTAAGVWVGGLLMVLLAGIPAMLRLPSGNQHAAVSALVNSFHPIALFCAPTAVLAGSGLAWIRLGSLDALWPSPYGRTLLVKLGLVAGVAGLGAYNSLRARRRLSGGDALGTSRFRITGAVELAFGALVIVATTFLVVTPVPSEMGVSAQ